MKGSVVLAGICVFSSIFCYARASNILGLFGCASHSHHLWNEVLVNALAERGHILTIISVDENNSPKPNVTYIHMEKTYELKHLATESLDDVSGLSSRGAFTNTRFLFALKMLTCRGIFESNGFQDALNLHEKFDLILYDTETGPCMLRLIEKHPNVPVVGVTAFKMDPRVVEIFGGHSYPSYIPHMLKKHEMPMNIFKRLANAATYAYAYLYKKLFSERYIEAMAEKYIPDLKEPLASLYKRIRIVLVNTHPTMDYAQSLPPNIVEVGGLHIQNPKPLPNNINGFLNSAKEGAILIALGSNLKAEILGEKRLEALINVIKKFPDYNFLWKVENKGVLKELPKNLMIQKWMPQNDILAHPKMKAFFTHAGGLSMQEATFHGVPVVAMPVYVDQFNNAYRAEQNGYGRVVKFHELNEDTVYSTFSEVLNNPIYSKNMRELQKKFHDRQNKPLDSALWWIEYILRNPQTDHLSPYSRNMSYFEANSLDIVLICFVIVIALFLSTLLLLKNLKKLSTRFKRTFETDSKPLSKME